MLVSSDEAVCHGGCVWVVLASRAQRAAIAAAAACTSSVWFCIPSGYFTLTGSYHIPRKYLTGFGSLVSIFYLAPRWHVLSYASTTLRFMRMRCQFRHDRSPVQVLVPVWGYARADFNDCRPLGALG